MNELACQSVRVRGRRGACPHIVHALYICYHRNRIMHIEEIRLKNFRVFQDVVMRDIPHFAVLVGANGSGKSTLFFGARFSARGDELQCYHRSG